MLQVSELAWRLRAFLFLFLFLVLVSGGSAEASCIEYSNYLNLEGWCELGTASPRPSMVQLGDLVYLAAADDGIVAYDVTIPGNPVPTAITGTRGRPQDLHWREGRLAAAEGGSGVSRYLLTSPTSLTLDAWAQTGTPALAVIQTPDWLIVGTSGGSLHFYDWTGTGELPAQHTFSWPGTIRDLAVDAWSRRLFVAVEGHGVVIIDIEPHDPVEIRLVPGTEDGYCLAWLDRFLHVGLTSGPTGGGELVTVDARLVEAAYIVDRLSTSGAVVDLSLHGTTLAAATEQGGFELYDVSTGYAPLGRGGLAWGQWTYGVHLDQVTGALYSLDLFLYQGSMRFAAWTGIEYGPVLPVSSWTPGQVQDLLVAGGRLYVGTENQGIICATTGFESLGTAALASPVHRLALDNSLLYAANDASGLTSIDISDPGDPIVLDSLACGTALDVALGSDFALVATAQGEVHGVDLTNPQALSLTESIRPSPDVEYRGVVGSGRWYYALGRRDVGPRNEGHITVIDCDDPLHPREAVQVPGPGGLEGTYWRGALVGEVLIVASESEVSALDVRNPQAPIWLDTIHPYDEITSWKPVSLVAHDDLVYVATARSGVHVLDVLDPTDLRWIGFLDPGEEAIAGVAANADEVFVAAAFDGVLLTPAQCAPRAGLPDLLASGLALPPNWPNPFNPLTTVQYEVDQDCEISLDLYDVAGRHVRRLIAGPQQAGTHSVRWNGRDERGRSSPSGVYLVRLVAQGQQVSRKITLAR
jgi:hypothetical protein